MEALQTRYRICPVCEAACSLKVETRGREVVSCRGNPDDAFSVGHVCPKGVALAQLDADPDRLRVPLRREGDRHVEVSWEDAYELICARLGAVRDAHGDDAVAVYIGNPTAHNVGLSMGLGPFAAALGSRNVFSAGSVDQLPKQLACEFMFGNDMAIGIPDIERCDYLLMLGANPIVSNGSLWVVPGVRGHLRSFSDRGGKLVTIDPRRTETGRLADQHHFIRPGTDVWLLGALFNLLLDSGRRPVVAQRGFDALCRALAPISLDLAADRTGIPVAVIQQIATDLDTIPAAAVYGRVGTTLQRHGTLTSFLIDTLNVMTGALDHPGGVMFPEQAFAEPREAAHGLQYDRYRSRVSGYPEVIGQMPVACLAEEIETPGPGQIRALVSVAGNPVVSNPDSRRLARALESLDFMVAIDIYHNETTRHADVILPGTSPFEDGHYDSFLGAMTYRNTARYSPPVFSSPDRPDEWRLMLAMAHICAQRRVASEAELDAFEDVIVAGAVHRYVEDSTSGVAGRDVQELVGAIGPQRGVERLLDLGIRAGPWGDHFGRTDGRADGLTLDLLSRSPNSIDKGPLRSRLAEVVRHKEGCIDLAPEPILSALGRLTDEPDEKGLLLIGRRNIQTNNSWLHNLPLLAKGPARCRLEMHPEDADSIGVDAGQFVAVRSRVGEIEVEVVVTADLSPGVVCLPHGFSEELRPRQAVAAARTGANSNDLAPADYLDDVSGTVALNGIPVTVRASRRTV